MRIRKNLLLIMVITFLLIPGKIFAETESPKDLQERLSNAVVLYVGSSKAYVNNTETMVDASDSEVCPLVMDNRTLVPVRFISENLGADVEWNKNSRTVSVGIKDKTVKLVLGSKKMLINDKETALEVPAKSISGRTFLPLRALVEALDKKVLYYKGLIIISDKENIIDTETEKVLVHAVISLFYDKGSIGSDMLKMQAVVWKGEWIYYISADGESIDDVFETGSWGSAAVFQIEKEGAVAVEEMDSIREVIRKRLDSMGLLEASVNVDFQNKKFTVVIPDVDGIQKTIENLRKPSRLEFKDPDGKVIIDSNDIIDAQYELMHQSAGRKTWVVSVKFTPTASKKFADATEKLSKLSAAGKNFIGIYLDEQLISSPSVNQRIDSDSAIIEGADFTAETAKELASSIRSGSLIDRLQVISCDYITRLKTNLYKVKSDGTDKLKVADNVSGPVYMEGDWIYYFNNEDNYSLYRVKTDGTEKTKVR